MKKIPYDYAAVAFSIAIIWVYWATRSISLDDFDSAQFALGIDNFDMASHQPHPPGYPVYIFMGKISNLFFSSGTDALIALSVLFGASSVFLVYLWGKQIGDAATGLAAAALTAFTPIFWLDSVKALTDVPGLFFVLLAGYLLYIAWSNPSRTTALPWAAFIVGLAAGVRLHSLGILLPLFLLTLAGQKAKQKIGAILAFTAGLALWLAPTIIVSGKSGYWQPMAHQFSWRFGNSAVSIIGSRIDLESYFSRAYDFLRYFLYNGYLVNLAKDRDPRYIFLFLMTIYIVANRKHLRFSNKNFRFATVALVPYVILLFIMLPPHNPRYLLVLVPLASFAAADFCFRVLNRKIGIVLLAVLLSVFLMKSLRVAKAIHTTPSSYAQVVDFFNGHPDKRNAAILGNRAYGRHAKYSGEHLNIHMPKYRGCKGIANLLDRFDRVWTSHQMDCPGLESSKIFEGYRDPRIHWKHHRIAIYEYVKKKGR